MLSGTLNTVYFTLIEMLFFTVGYSHGSRGLLMMEGKYLVFAKYIMFGIFTKFLVFWCTLSRMDYFTPTLDKCQTLSFQIHF